MKIKTIISAITAAILFGVLPLAANAADISWSTENYYVYSYGYDGSNTTYLEDSATSSLSLPITVEAGTGDPCPESYAQITSSTMYTRAYAISPCNADSGASFTGTFLSAMPSFTFDYSLDNTVGMTSLYVNDNGTEIFNEFLSAGSDTLIIPITVGNTIEVGFGQGAYNSDTTLNYAMAVAPEPISSVLFVTGSAILGFRQLRRKTGTA